MANHFSVRLRCLLLPLVACATLTAASAVHATCATSVEQLRAILEDPAFPLHWEETGTGDARPLLVTLDDRSAGLFISFMKAGEGLLAEGPAQVCRRADRLEARFRQDGLQVGAAASLMLKSALRSGIAVRLQSTGPGRLRIGTIGWSGDFVPGSLGVGLRTSFGPF